MNRKERRKDIVPTRVHAKFIYTDKQQLPLEIKTTDDWRTIAYIQVEWYASTKVRDGSWDVVVPEGIDLTRFEAGNAPLKAMHWRGTLSNVGVILQATKDTQGLYIKAEARLDISKDNNWRPINEHDYTLFDRLMNRTINGFSIGFHWIQEHYDEEKEANIITYLKLHEISLVDVPDNPLTIVKMLEVYREQTDNILQDDEKEMNTPKFVEVNTKDAEVNTADVTADTEATEESTEDETVEVEAVEEEAEETVEEIDDTEIADDEDAEKELDDETKEEATEESEESTEEEEKSLEDEDCQESESDWNVTTDEATEEVVETGDKGIDNTSEKELDSEVVKVLEKLPEAMKLIQEQSDTIKKLTRELKEYKKLKVEAGLVLQGSEEKTSNAKLDNVVKFIENWL